MVQSNLQVTNYWVTLFENFVQIATKIQLRANIISTLTDNEWLVLLGGINEVGFLSSVELFNWKTGEQCHLLDLPHAVYGHVGAVLEGVPVFCGGDNGFIQYKCFKFNLTDMTWNRVSTEY